MRGCISCCCWGRVLSSSSSLPSGKWNWAEVGRRVGAASLEMVLTCGCCGSWRTGGEARLSSEEMLWFQACCRSMGMILVASLDTHGGRKSTSSFHGRFFSPHVGDGGATDGLWHTSKTAESVEGKNAKEYKCTKRIHLILDFLAFCAKLKFNSIHTYSDCC